MLPGQVSNPGNNNTTTTLSVYPRVRISRSVSETDYRFYLSINCDLRRRLMPETRCTGFPALSVDQRDENSQSALETDN